MIISEPKSVKTTRIARRIHTPLKYSNYVMLLFGLFTLQHVNKTNLNINHYKQMSFFKAQLDHVSEISKLFDGSNNAFLPIALQADLSSNDTLYYGQTMKVEDSEDFKSAMKKEINNLYEAKVFDIM